ncbi:MAG: hypothetical protein MK207_07340 [Saprospiraceae bacterium]|nr:hypothetical protein [Saprospiraceae bacterium]
MKNQNFTFLFIIFLFFVSCDNTISSGAPDDTMRAFIEKMKLLDFEGAKEFTTNNTDATLDFLSTRIQILKDMGKEEQIPTLFGGIDFTQATATCVTKESRATCKCCEENSDNCKDISVVQEGGKWLINIPKEATIHN